MNDGIAIVGYVRSRQCTTPEKFSSRPLLSLNESHVLAWAHMGKRDQGDYESIMTAPMKE